ncbi:MAG TPA: porin [Elusimicrobiota bacterium]|nr:porin [Elusimicrobiota bacterium]
MKRALTVLTAAALIAGTVPLALAAEPYNEFNDRGITVVNNDKLSMDIWGRGQMLGVGEIVPDPVSGAGHERVYEFLKQARLGFNGKVNDLFNFQIEMDYGGENQNSSQSSAGSYDLMDFVADVPVRPLGENTIVKIGQFRVPYGREVLQDEGYQDFGDRSIAALATNHGRDFGVALMGTHENWTGTIGTFPDGGRDIAQRYLPENMGIPELVTRFGYNDGVDKDIYHVMGTDRNLTRDTKAFFLNGLFETDTRIGHSTALQSHSTDGNLLEDKNFNPYFDRSNQSSLTANNTGICSASTCERGRLWNVGGDAVYRHPISKDQAVEGEGEVDWGGYNNRYGTLHIASARAQGDYQLGKWEIGARYALLSLDSNSGYLSVTGAAGVPANEAFSHATVSGNGGSNTTTQYTTGMGKPIHEITPSITYHFMGQTMKLVADMPIYLDVPLIIAAGDGAYVFPDQGGASPAWDQITAAAGGVGDSVIRRVVVEPRMMFQWQF